jgi:putative transposase
VIQQHPFKFDAIVVLANHIHCIWTLPKHDADFSTRWRLIKSWFSRQCHVKYQAKLSASRRNKGEKAVWQRRFWEHLIRDEEFINHVNYIHYNRCTS